MATWEEGRPGESGPPPPRRRGTEPSTVVIPRREKQTGKRGEEARCPLKRSQLLATHSDTSEEEKVKCGGASPL